MDVDGLVASSLAPAWPSLRAVAPEAFLLLGACGAFAAACSPRAQARRRVAEIVVALSALAALLATLLHGFARIAALPAPLSGSSLVPGGPSWSVLWSLSPFGGLLCIDGWVSWVRLLALAGLAVTMTASHSSAEVHAIDAPASGASRDDAGPEYLGLLATATAASSLMAASSDILTAFLTIELASLPSYLLVAFRRRSSLGAEAALKYVIYGSVASGVSLFGFSWLYGAAGATAFADLSRGFAQAPVVAAIGALLVLAGLAFKLAVVPFHMWAPDAFQGAPAPVAMFLSLVPKAGALILLGRFASHLHAPAVTGAVAALAALSMTWGNVAALAQTQLRRVLAYSAIAHAGTMLLAFVTSSPAATTALVIYLAAYLCMNLVAFLCVAYFASAGAETLDDYRGLGGRAPLVAAVLTIALFSLTGLPPLAGFLGKFTLFAALLSEGFATSSSAPLRFLLLGLVALGLLNTVVSLAYYARVVRALYFEAAGPSGKSAGPFEARVLPRLSFTQAAVMLLLTAGTLGLGVAPGALLAWASRWTTPATLAGRASSAASSTASSTASSGTLLRDEGPAR